MWLLDLLRTFVAWWRRGSSLRAAGPIVYIDGIFDLFHEGHVRFMQKARAVGGPNARLLVGVITDEDASWKRAPVMLHSERVSVVDACRYVNGVVRNPPLILDRHFIEQNNISYVVHGDDDKQEKFFQVPIQMGIMRYVPYHRGVSTTDILKRVAKSEREPPC